MEFPFGHNHHHHHRDDDEDERNRLRPQFPPALNFPEVFQPHQPGSGFAPPPPFFEPPTPPFFGVPTDPPSRTSHHADDPSRDHHRPGYSDDVRNQGDGEYFKGQQTVRVFTKAEENYSLSIRDGKVVLTRQDPSDEYQHWFKDMKYSTKVKDEEGFPAFALVNKATGQAIKHSVGATHPVQLVPYKPNFLDESVLWTESRDLGDGFRCIRMVNNISLNFDAFNGDEDHGGVHEGTVIVLWEWLKGKNQRWKIAPH